MQPPHAAVVAIEGVVVLQALGPAARAFGREDRRLDRRSHMLGEVVLQVEHVLDLPLEPLGPGVAAAFAVQQVDDGAHPGPGTADAAGHQVAHAQFAADLLRRDLAVLVGGAGAVGDHEQRAPSGEGVDHLLGDGVGEILLVRIAAQVLERQDGDRGFRRARRPGGLRRRDRGRFGCVAGGRNRGQGLAHRGAGFDAQLAVERRLQGAKAAVGGAGGAQRHIGADGADRDRLVHPIARQIGFGELAHALPVAVRLSLAERRLDRREHGSLEAGAGLVTPVVEQAGHLQVVEQMRVAETPQRRRPWRPRPGPASRAARRRRSATSPA